jgi:hypothetical protein
VLRRKRAGQHYVAVILKPRGGYPVIIRTLRGGRVLKLPEDRLFKNRPFFSLQWSRSMFKKLVPVVSLLLLAAGPVMAADTAAPSTDSSASAPAKSTHKSKHHSKKHKAAKTTTDSSAPK